jgi:predicted NUDIX family NTP pyrophosphohydrolase
MEWPKGSGRVQRYPEVDHVVWVPLADVEESLHMNQVRIAEAMRVYLRSLLRGKECSERDGNSVDSTVQQGGTDR